jgi:sigma-E factor negative regulatory protein RseA
MDDETDELEIRRVLTQADVDELRETWKRYQLASDVMSGSEYAGMDVSAAVTAALDGNSETGSYSDRAADLASTQEPDKGISAKNFWSTAGIAASVVFAVLVGVQQLGNWISHPDARAVGPEPSVTSTYPANHSAEQDTGAIASVDDMTATRPFTDEQARRLNEYLLRHAEHASFGPKPGVVPIARVASFNMDGQ